MKSRSSRALAGLMLALMAPFVLASCGGGYDRDEAIQELEDAGIDNAIAVCIVDGMEEEFGEDKLGSTDDPTAEDEAKIQEITLACMVGS